MSEIMLLGVLRMPLPEHPGEVSYLDWVQIKDRMREAADALAAKDAEIARLKEALEEARNAAVDSSEVAGGMCIKVTALKEALRKIQNMAEQPAAMYAKNGPQWTAKDGSEFEDTSAYLGFADEIATAARRAFNGETGE